MLFFKYAYLVWGFLPRFFAYAEIRSMSLMRLSAAQECAKAHSLFEKGENLYV